MTDFKGLNLFGLRSPVGNMMDNDEEDVKNVKNALFAVGHAKEPAQNGIIDQPTEDAIRSFQREKGLKVDGYLLPGGETEKALRNIAELSRPSVSSWNLNENGKGQTKVLFENPIDAIKAFLVVRGVESDVKDNFSHVPEAHNNEADAFRHALLSYRLTKSINEKFAQEIGDAHERGNQKQGQSIEERNMDLHNNAVGRMLAQDPNNKGKSDIDVVMESIRQNRLITRLKKSGDMKNPKKYHGVTATGRLYSGGP